MKKVLALFTLMFISTLMFAQSKDSIIYSPVVGNITVSPDGTPDFSNCCDKPKDSRVFYKVQYLTKYWLDEDQVGVFPQYNGCYDQQENGYWRYMVGETSDYQEAKEILATVKLKYSDAFIVKFVHKKNGKIKRIN